MTKTILNPEVAPLKAIEYVVENAPKYLLFDKNDKI